MTAVAALAASVVLLYPGWLSFDSSYQFWQVRTGAFVNLSPVVMTAVWSVVYRFSPSPAAMLILHLAAYWTGILLLAIGLCRRVVARVAFVLGVGFLPPVVVILGHLWTDASLIAAMSLASGLTVTGLVRRSRSPLALALPVILYAGAVRHNSLLAIVPLSGLWAYAWLNGGPRSSFSRSSRRTGSVAGFAFLIVLASFVTGAALDRALARERVSTWAIGALWDLAAVSLDTGVLAIPEFARTPGMDLESLRSKYSTYVGVPLFDGQGRVRHGLGDEKFDAVEVGALRAAWLAAITAHPFAYARHRFAVSKNLFGRYGGPLEGLFFVPTVVPFRDNPPPEEALVPELRGRLIEVVRTTRGSLIFSPGLYLMTAMAAFVLGWRRRQDMSGRLAMAFAGSGLLLVLPLTLFAPSAELRYCGWLFTSSVVALVAISRRRVIAEATGDPPASAIHG